MDKQILNVKSKTFYYYTVLTMAGNAYRVASSNDIPFGMFGFAGYLIISICATLYCVQLLHYTETAGTPLAHAIMGK